MVEKAKKQDESPHPDSGESEIDIARNVALSVFEGMFENSVRYLVGLTTSRLAGADTVSPCWERFLPPLC